MTKQQEPLDPERLALLAANLVKSADALAKAFLDAVAPIAEFYASLTDEQKQAIAKINFEREAPAYAQGDKNGQVQNVRGKSP